jgi:hypothetical protein
MDIVKKMGQRQYKELDIERGSFQAHFHDRDFLSGA